MLIATSTLDNFYIYWVGKLRQEQTNEISTKCLQHIHMIYTYQTCRFTVIFIHWKHTRLYKKYCFYSGLVYFKNIAEKVLNMIYKRTLAISNLPGAPFSLSFNYETYQVTRLGTPSSLREIFSILHRICTLSKELK